MGSNEGRVWVSLGGVGHVELSEGFFGLTSVGNVVKLGTIKRIADLRMLRKQRDMRIPLPQR